MYTIDILYVIANLNLGGAEVLVADWATAMQGKGFRIAVLCIKKKEGPLLSGIETAGIPVYQIDQKSIPEPIFAWRLSRLLKRIRPRVIHSQCPWSLPQQVFCGRMASVSKFILTFHNTYPRKGSWVDFRRRLAAGFARYPAMCYTAVSEQVRRHCAELYGIPESRILTIYNGIDTERFAPGNTTTPRALVRERIGVPADALTMLCVGSLSEQKDHATLLQALSLVPDPHPYLLLAGDGPLRADLESLADRLGIRNRVRFLGVRTDVPDLCGASDIFALTSQWEGFGLVVAKAMAMQMPVVATATGGVSEIITNRKNGMLVPVGKPEAVRDAIQDLRNDPAGAGEMARKARQTVVERFSRQTCLKAYCRLYDLGQLR